MHVKRTDEKLKSVTMPILQPVSQLSLDSSDCLIVCSGFEDRALGALKNALAVTSEFSVVIVNYQPLIAENHSTEIRSMCKESRLNSVEIDYDRQNPAGFGAMLLELLSKVPGHIFLDISAMSRLLIVQILVALVGRDSGFKECYVVYAEATDYPPTDSEVRQALELANEDPMNNMLLLSSGVFDITIVPELSSTSISGSQTRLVAFPTFNSDQLTALRNELGPSRITFINGIPPHSHNQWRTEAIAKINRLDSIPHEQALTSTLDYRETLATLLDLYARYSERERLLISPTGSKMQAVAVGLFRAFINDVQIVYPTPKEFCSPANYTRGVGQLHLLPLADFILPSTEKATVIQDIPEASSP